MIGFQIKKISPCIKVCLKSKSTKKIKKSHYNLFRIIIDNLFINKYLCIIKYHKWKILKLKR